MRPSRRQIPPFVRRWPVGRPSVTALLVALSIGAFAAQLISQFFLAAEAGSGLSRHETLMANGDLLRSMLALSQEGIAAHQYWRFLTAPFLHENLLHMFGNMALLYFAGREVENIVGPRHFLGIYIGGTLLGNAVQWLAMPEFPVMGVTAGVAAVIVAFTTILPELEIVVHLFFVLPLRLRAKYLAFAIAAVGAVCWFTFTASYLAPVGVLAACAFAWGYVKQLGFGNPLAIQRYIFEKRQRAARLDRMNPDQFVTTEIDPILDKISRHGMRSLTRAERKILEQGSDKISTRSTRK